ncbi:MAG: hypothetical protein M3R50_01285 [Bacteroidota bacterium]|nr:hypothetical protein [Bacteroidota bacterium]
MSQRIIFQKLKAVFIFESSNIYARRERNGAVNFRLSSSSGSSYIPLKSGLGPVAGDSTRVSAENTLQYIRIPFIFKRDVLSGRFTLYPSVGLGLNILSGNKIETELSVFNSTENTISNVKGLKQSYINTSVSLGAAYWLSKNISLNLEPAATFGLSPINQNTPVKTTLNTLGLSAGITFKL